MNSLNIPTDFGPDSGGRVKGLCIVKPIVYGNIARSFGKKREEDGHTHQWKVYIKPYRNECMSIYVKKVHFKLHESYDNPNRIVTKPPYEITETGWGEFEVVIKIYFHDPTERPVTLYHILKLFQSPVLDGELSAASADAKCGLVSESYEEIVFQEPTQLMQHFLLNVQPVTMGPYLHNTDFEEKKRRALENIIDVKKKVRTEIGELKEKLKLARETISKFTSELHKIVSLIDIYPDLCGLSLVLDFMPDTLYARLKNEVNPLSLQHVRKFSHQLLKGVGYLHGVGIMHRDIKPANLLISEDENLKIADFGLARLYFPEEKEKMYSPQVSTRWYRAPEILWGSQMYTSAMDMWASGCVIAEMLRGGVPLFAGTTDIEQLALVIRTLGSPRLNDWPELTDLPDYNKIRFPSAVCVHWDNIFPSCTHAIEINLVSNLVVYNPKNRLKAIEAVQHDYFN